MSRHKGSAFGLSDEERGKVVALGRKGARFGDIAAALKCSASTANNYWNRFASESDKRERDLMSSDLSRARLSHRLGRDSTGQIGDDRFAGCTFVDDPRAMSDAVGSIGRPEPFGFSLYGGTFR
jgi:hypothetical protein